MVDRSGLQEITAHLSDIENVERSVFVGNEQRNRRQAKLKGITGRCHCTGSAESACFTHTGQVDVSKEI